jgi:hypothetical protein
VECTINSVFCGGTFYGLLIGAIVGFVFNSMRENRGRMGQQNRTFNTFPASAQSRTTSREVVRRSLFASIGCVFWAIVLVFTIVAILYVTNYLLDNVIKDLFNC